MNVVLLVVDSLRAQSLGDTGGPATSFLRGLATESICFRRAYATECWTLPAHVSMFTGLLPSEHGAHFRSMSYTGPAPTVAERLAAAGYDTEVVTRNSVFDGTIPGILRGFASRRRIVSRRASGLNPLALALALSKPRFRRQVLSSGFFSAGQRQSWAFLTDFARATVPADREALEYVLDRMAAHQRAGRPYFLFANLYDVHAPYPPSQTGIFRPWRTLDDCLENVTMPFVLPCLGSHRYLRSGFRLSARSRRALLARYHRAVELMDAKLGTFCSQARAAGLLDDTLLVVTSDHGEAFGDHGLYLHDASVYQTHLHVPLYVQHRGLQPATVDDVVSMRHLSEMLCAAANGPSFAGTILDPDFRGRHAIALAEHFHYPHAPKASPRYRRDLAAAIVGRDKVIVRRGEVERYDVQVDPGEESPQPGSVDDLMEAARRDGVARPIVASALSHLRRWQEVAQ